MRLCNSVRPFAKQVDGLLREFTPLGLAVCGYSETSRETWHITCPDKEGPPTELTVLAGQIAIRDSTGLEESLSEFLSAAIFGRNNRARSNGLKFLVALLKGIITIDRLEILDTSTSEAAAIVARIREVHAEFLPERSEEEIEVNQGSAGQAGSSDLNDLVYDIRKCIGAHGKSELRLGQLLLKAKAAVGHGEFIGWFALQEFGNHLRTAERYMALATFAVRAKFDTVSNFEEVVPGRMSFASAYLLGRPGIPEEVILQVARSLRDGKSLKDAEVKNVFRQLTAPQEPCVRPSLQPVQASTFEEALTIDLPSIARQGQTTLRKIRSEMRLISEAHERGDHEALKSALVSLFNRCIPLVSAS